MTGPGSMLRAVGHALDIGQRRLRYALFSVPKAKLYGLVLDDGRFEGKRVIVVGPAATVVDELKDFDLDGYDVIVRLNNGIAIAEADPPRLGRRTDVLFHNLKEAGNRPAGDIGPDRLLAAGVELCVSPHWNTKTTMRRLLAKRRQLKAVSDIEVKLPPLAFCQRVVSDLDGYKPTTGASAVLYLLECPVAELAVVGFTFFETSYVKGYNAKVSTDADAQAWVDDVHDIAREKALVGRRIGEARRAGRTVRLGRQLAHRLDLPV